MRSTPAEWKFGGFDQLLGVNKYINVDKKRQDTLRRQFPDLLKLEECEDTDKYQYFGISVFDHWLSRNEAEDLLDDVTPEEQQRRNSLFAAFNEKLIKNTEVLHFVLRGNYKKYYKFRNFTSENNLSNYLKHTSCQHYAVILPELSIVYFEGYDDTNCFYLRDASHRAIIETWATDVGLHCLDSPSI